MALKGNQKKLDKNNNNRIDAQDFKILKAEKAKGRGMGLQDEKVKPGKVMKAKKGSGLDLPVIKSVKPKINKKSLHKNLMKTKNPYSDLVKTTAKGPPRYSSMEEMRRAKGFKPGESAASFNKRRAEMMRAKDAAKALGTRGKIALGVAAAGVGAVQYLKSKMKKKDKKMGGGMMKKPMGYDRGGMYLTDEKIKKVFPEKDPKRRANISQLVGGDRVSPMKKERFTAGQSARRRGILKKIGREVAKATPLGLGIKVAEVTKKLKDKIKKRSEGGPAATAGRPISKAPQRRGMGGKKKRDMVVILGGSEKSLTGKGGLERDANNKPYRYSYSTDPFLKNKTILKISNKNLKMGGGMMNKPMGYKAGKSVKVKCKLGRNKPTKMY